jgi:hypothetical protein
LRGSKGRVGNPGNFKKGEGIMTTPQERKVIINGDVLMYKDKAPFVPAGKSVMGALEYNEPEDKIKCHVCGQWFTRLNPHLVDKHKITAREYKRKFGLRYKTALVNESQRKTMAKAALERFKRNGKNDAIMRASTVAAKLAYLRSKQNRKPRPQTTTGELMNAKQHCSAQLLEKIRTAALTMGRTPSAKELRHLGVPPSSLIMRFGSVNQAVKLAKLEPNGNIGSKNHRWYSDKLLLAGLRLFRENNQREPNQSDCRRGLIPASAPTYAKRFGSWRKALLAAKV